MKNYYNETNSVSLDSLHSLIDFYEQSKNIELNKTYWASEWSWQPMCDGIYSYEQEIRQHLVVEGIDVYFTNTNYRFYLKEDLYDSKDMCDKMCSWKNEFSYNYVVFIDRKKIIEDLIEYKEIDGKIIWNIK